MILLFAYFEVFSPAPSLLTIWLVFVAMGAAFVAWFRFNARANLIQVPIFAVVVGGAVWDFSNPSSADALGRATQCVLALAVGALAASAIRRRPRRAT